MKYYVYILQCADGTLYTGVTKDLQNRLDRHNSGHGARYTRGRLPVSLVYYEESGNIKSAMAREMQIRQLSRSDKRELIDKFGNN
ncbi:MAG: GIY-YIG nuclease family protein [bacterium]